MASTEKLQNCSTKRKSVKLRFESAGAEATFSGIKLTSAPSSCIFWDIFSEISPLLQHYQMTSKMMVVILFMPYKRK